MESKSALRRIVRDRGELYDGRTRAAMSQRVMEAVGRFPPFADAASVALYWSLPAEVDTHAFVEKWAVRKKVYLPVMRGDGLSLRKFTGPKRTAGSPFRDQGAGRGGRDLPAADRPDRGSGRGVRSVRKPSRARQRILRSVADARRTAENRRLFRIPVFRACSRRCARRAGRLGRMRVGTGGALVPGRRFTVFIIRSYPAKFGNRSQKSAIFAFGTPSKKLKCES